MGILGGRTGVGWAGKLKPSTFMSDFRTVDYGTNMYF